MVELPFPWVLPESAFWMQRQASFAVHSQLIYVFPYCEKRFINMSINPKTPAKNKYCMYSQAKINCVLWCWLAWFFSDTATEVCCLQTGWRMADMVSRAHPQEGLVKWRRNKSRIKSNLISRSIMDGRYGYLLPSSQQGSLLHWNPLLFFTVLYMLTWPPHQKVTLSWTRPPPHLSTCYYMASLFLSPRDENITFRSTQGVVGLPNRHKRKLIL